MKNTLPHGILIASLLFSPATLATGFATHDGAAAGRQGVICSGVNGSGQAAGTGQADCDAGGKNMIQPSLRGSPS